MPDVDFTCYPTVEEQAIEVANTLHDELHLTIDQINTEVSPKAAVCVYVALIQQAKRYLLNLTGKDHE